MKNVLVLGASGMLGSMVTDYLLKKDDIDLTISLRDNEIRRLFVQKYNFTNMKIKYLDFSNPIDYSMFNPYLIGYDFIINCIGITKPFIKEDDFNTIKNAIEINSILPYYLKDFCERHNTILIQILTDCVFSGKSVDCYEENDFKDAIDIYGKSKIMGECISKDVINLRTSIIGPEINSCNFLFEWLLQNKDKEINGFSNHYWNGITTLAFAKIVYGLIQSESNIYTNNIYHLFSKLSLDKYSLLLSLIHI